MNSGIAFGIFLSNFLGFAIPLNDGRENAIEKMKNDSNWYFVIVTPAIFNVISIRRQLVACLRVTPCLQVLMPKMVINVPDLGDHHVELEITW